jgi:hypothetical protein
MYVALPKKPGGLQLYRTLRSSSAQEGYHLHLSRCIAAGSKSSSVEWLDAVRCEFDWLWTVRAMKKVGWFGNVQHFNFQLVDRVDAAAKALQIPEAAAYSKWQQTQLPANDEVLVRQGVFYAKAAVVARFRKAQQDAWDEAIKSGLSAEDAAAARSKVSREMPPPTMETVRHLRVKATAEDIQTLMAPAGEAGEEADNRIKAALQDRALLAGLQLSEADAKAMVKRLVHEELAWTGLKANGYLHVVANKARKPSAVTHRAVSLPGVTPASQVPITRVSLAAAAVGAGARMNAGGATWSMAAPCPAAPQDTGMIDDAAVQSQAPASGGSGGKGRQTEQAKEEIRKRKRERQKAVREARGDELNQKRRKVREERRDELNQKRRKVREERRDELNQKRRKAEEHGGRGAYRKSGKAR